MSIFDLLFIVLFLATVLTLCTMIALALRGQRARAITILRRWGVCAGIYLGIVVVVSLLLPLRVLNVGDLLCSDDWCIAVEHVDRKPVHSQTSYLVTLRLSCRARRVPQRENSLVVYVSDDENHRYDPAPDASAIPFNVLLQPGQSVTTTRTFTVPADAHRVGLVVSHEGGLPMRWFIIGRSPFQRTIVKLDQ